MLAREAGAPAGSLLRRAVLAMAMAGFLVGACDSSRERPTGFGSDVPLTTVRILSPPADGRVPSDSLARVVVGATGLVVAVGYVLSQNTLFDTLAAELRPLGGPHEVVEEEFAVPIPDLETGSQLRIVGFAEDIIGVRHVSSSIVVTAVECDLFPTACVDF